LFGIGKRIIADVIEEDNEDTYHEILEFFQSIWQKMSWQEILKSNSEGNLNIQNDNDIIKIQKIQNPVYEDQKVILN